ncbi:hypothetical protein GCWU000341_02017 [Oribacterium sp. oral taxon 078 str. F0262]|nr:hypothetical protein GCWU000341_02017 [Oribacterium sp. oral taxon 078 str. F0262]
MGRKHKKYSEEERKVQLPAFLPVDVSAGYAIDSPAAAGDMQGP